jgi:soluble lytic murein transglycosylase
MERMAARSTVWAGALVVGIVLAGSPAPAAVRIVVQADGSRTITNDGGSVSPRAMVKRPPPAHLDPVIQRHADATSLDPRLVEAVIQVESGYNSRAVSRKGAQGLMQLMPQTARELGVKNPFDPEENVGGGTRYLRSMLDAFGSLDLALAAYNAGPNAVQRHRGVPPYRETRDYVGKVLGLLNHGRFSSGSLEIVSFTPSAGLAGAASASRAEVPASLQSGSLRAVVVPKPKIIRRQASPTTVVTR